MANYIQDFRADFPIVDPETGKITPEFLRFIHQRKGNMEVTDGTATDALDTATDALDTATDAEILAAAAQATATTAQGEVDALEAVVAALGLDDLTDVDTTTTPPTDQQALIYDNASSLWIPGDVASGGGGGGGAWESISIPAPILPATSLDIPFAGYDEVIIIVHALAMSSSSFPLAQFTSGGALISGASDYYGVTLTATSEAAADSNGFFFARGSATSHRGTIKIDCASQAGRTVFNTLVGTPTTQAVVRQGYCTAGVHDGLRLTAASGNINSATIEVYGRSTSGGGGSSIYAVDYLSHTGAFSGSAYATKGNRWEALEDLTIKGIGFQMSETQSYEFAIYIVDSSGVILSKEFGDTAVRTIGVNLVTLPTPVSISAGEYFAIVATRKGAGNTAVARVPYPGSTSTETTYGFTINSDVRVALETPTIGDTLAASGVSDTYVGTKILYGI